MSTSFPVGSTYPRRKQGEAVLLLFLSLFATLQRTSATCYYPDGSIAATDTPCSSNGASTCCGNGYACLSNRICMATGDEAQKADASLYVRGSCTDQSWSNANCPLFCIGSNDLLSGGMGVAKCPNTALDEYYCIDSGDSTVNCTTDFNVFEFAGTPSALTTIGVIGPVTTSSASSSSLTTSTSQTTSSPTTSTTTTSTTGPVLASSVATLPSTTSTLISSAASSTASSMTPTSQPAPSDHAVAIGVGVAVPCGLIIAGLLGFICFRLRKSKHPTTSDIIPQYHTGGQPPNYYSGVMKQELDGATTKPTRQRPLTHRYELPSSQQ